jgi:hypothetical protein
MSLQAPYGTAAHVVIKPIIKQRLNWVVVRVGVNEHALKQRCVCCTYETYQPNIQIVLSWRVAEDGMSNQISVTGAQ